MDLRSVLHIFSLRPYLVYRCRLIQKAIKSISHEDLSTLIEQFREYVYQMIQDCHGNHVIQRCIQTQSSHANQAESKGDKDTALQIMNSLQFIIEDVVKHIKSLSIHRYGCRIVQRSLEFCLEEQKHQVLKAISLCADDIAEDIYGNYVVQRAITQGNDLHREEIFCKLTRRKGKLNNILYIRTYIILVNDH